MRRYQVIICGAWPAGTIAAYRLIQQGINVLLLESTPEPGGPMRASTFNPATLDMMEDLGWLEELESNGLRAPVYQHRNLQSQQVYSLDFTEIADKLRHPYRLHCDQEQIARMGLRKLTGHPDCEVRFQHRLVNIEQDDKGVTAYAETIYGIEAFSADYMIAAEGTIPITHGALGVQFHGTTWPQKFLALSTTHPFDDHFEDLARVNYIADAPRWYVLLRTPSYWHVLIPAEGPEADSTLLSDAYKDSVFVGLIGSGVNVSTERRAVLRIHQRVAERYNFGRVLLMGEGAHINLPLGGWGLNSGIHDAWNLTDKLNTIINDGADAQSQFARYDRQRRTTMEAFFQSTTTGPEFHTNRREWELSTVMHDERKRRDYLLDQAMVKSLKQEAHII